MQWVKSKGLAVMSGLLLVLAGSHALGASQLQARVQELLDRLSAGEPGQASGVALATERAEAGLQRADEAARQQQPQQVIDAWQGAALEWARWGRDQLRLAAKEERATALETQLLEARARLRRARAFLEETEARKGRAQTRLQQLEAERSATDAAGEEQP